MKRSILLFAVVAINGVAMANANDQVLKDGARAYRACVACHALVPGLHLSGPSLAGVWGREAGKAAGFTRYSKELRAAGFNWNEAALDGWLRKPAEMIPDTTMAFDGIKDDRIRADLLAFLKFVSQDAGPAKAVAKGLISQQWVRGPEPPMLKDSPANARVVSARHCGDGYTIKTEDGKEVVLWEKNVRIKIDSVETGPPKGVAILLGAGMRGDRFFLIFSSLDELNRILSETCK